MSNHFPIHVIFRSYYSHFVTDHLLTYIGRAVDQCVYVCVFEQ